MDDSQYLEYCRDLLDRFTADMEQRTAGLDAEDPLRQWVLTLADDKLDIYGQGPALVERLFTTYPDFAPLFPRELLWFLGGECLHYMPDDEIARHQQLEELRAEAAARGEVIDFQAARAKLLNLQ